MLSGIFLRLRNSAWDFFGFCHLIFHMALQFLCQNFATINFFFLDHPRYFQSGVSPWGRVSPVATTHHIIGTDHNQDNMLQEHLACNYHAHVPSQYHPHHDIQHDLHSYHSTCDDHNICCNYFSGG